jgi:hypothetical protein
MHIIGKLPDFTLPTRASFDVVSWGYDQTPADLNIRIFAVTATKQITQLTYNQADDWDSELFIIPNTSLSLFTTGSTVSAVRTPGNKGTETIRIFYQAERNVIAKYNITDGVRAALGIPTTLDVGAEESDESNTVSDSKNKDEEKKEEVDSKPDKADEENKVGLLHRGLFLYRSFGGARFRVT